MHYVKHVVLFVYVHLFITALSAEVGCMDNSKHRDISDGYDYKRLHYVYCSCPCKMHKNLSKKGRCSKCLHFHDPKDIYQF